MNGLTLSASEQLTINIINGKTNLSESRSLFDGKLQVRKFDGTSRVKVSDDELADVEKSIINIRDKGGDEGKLFVMKLLASAKDPFTIILNDQNLVGSKDFVNNIVVDLNPKERFIDFAKSGKDRLTRFSHSRIIAHELGHALFGRMDETTYDFQLNKTYSPNVEKIDQIMKDINGTVRKYYRSTHD